MGKYIEMVAKAFGRDPYVIEKKAVRTYLLSEYARIVSEIRYILGKYGVKSFEELEDKIERGEINVPGDFDDYTKLDALLAAKETIEKLLDEIDKEGVA